MMNSAQKKLYSTILRHLKKSKILNIFSKSKRIKGFYIYGKVGSGKTHTLKKIYSELSDTKRFFHYQSFMLFIHTQLKKLKVNNSQKNLDLLTDLLIKKYKYIFIDELEILDITDAMIIKELIPKITQRGVTVFFSTNIEPNNLYLEGIQRESFTPFIQYILEEFLISELNNVEDYRNKFSNHTSKTRFYIPNSKKNNDYLSKVFSNFSEGQPITRSYFLIGTRKFPCMQYSHNSIFIDFDRVFNGVTSPKDFEIITQKFQHIFIINIRKILSKENNVIKRFINFIDLSYIEKNILYMTSKLNMDEIYKNGNYKNEYIRTLSRLKEMETF